MELRLRNLFSKLVVLLFSSLFGDVEKFVSRAHFLVQSFSTILWSNCEEKVVQKVGCKSGGEERISVAEMNAMMSGVGMVFGVEGINGNSSVGAEDAVTLFEEEEPSLDEIEETFRVFDVNKDGFIDASELCRVVSNFRGRCDVEECHRMIRAFDTNGDGLIDFHEFLKFMENCL